MALPAANVCYLKNSCTNYVRLWASASHLLRSEMGAEPLARQLC